MRSLSSPTSQVSEGRHAHYDGSLPFCLSKAPSQLSMAHVPPHCRRARVALRGPLMPEDMAAQSFVTYQVSIGRYMHCEETSCGFYNTTTSAQYGTCTTAL